MKNKSLFSTKKNIIGSWVAIMDHERNDRSLQLSRFSTRCVKINEIHEFLICNETTDLSVPINQVAYLGFGEMSSGGVIETGDFFYSGSNLIGKIVGFDETHSPNHYNIIIQGPVSVSGALNGLSLKDNFSICK